MASRGVLYRRSTVVDDVLVGVTAVVLDLGESVYGSMEPARWQWICSYLTARQYRHINKLIIIITIIIIYLYQTTKIPNSKRKTKQN